MTAPRSSSRLRAPPRAAAVRLGVLVVVLGGVGCEPPDHPSTLPETLPEAVDGYLAPDSARVTRLAEGVFYRYLWSARGPWAVHLVEATLDRCDLGIQVAPAPRQPGLRGGRATVSALAAVPGSEVIAAVNGDFFTPEGIPLGPEVAAGVRRTGRERPALAVQEGGGLPWIGTTGVTGDRVTETGWRLEAGEHGAVHVVGGWPELLDRGRRVGDLMVGSNASFAASRHPRTAVAVSPEDRRLWLVVVDGRQGAYSTGMTLPELTGLLEALGAEEALNLDGGGSSVLIVRGRTISRPSDDAGERAVANALLLVEGTAQCRPVSGPEPP